MSLANWLRCRVGYRVADWLSWRNPAERARYNQLIAGNWAAQFLPFQEQQARQLEKLRALLVHAGTHVPYYRDLFHSLHFDPSAIRNAAELEALPVLTKEIIQDRQKDLLVEHPERYGAYRNATGGSTGHPLNYSQCRNYLVHDLAGAWTSDTTAGRKRGASTAILWAAPQDLRSGPGGLRELSRRALKGMYHYDAYNMSEQRMFQYFNHMQRLRPDVLLAYAESLHIFACFLRQHGLVPRFPRVSIITSAGTLFDFMRETISDVFPAPIFDRYGCREVGMIAYECDQHCGLHVDMNDQVVELNGEDPLRKPAQILITNLNNYAMPFIRYRIGDLAQLSDKRCACGRAAPLLARIEGRITDTITTRDGRLIYGAQFRHVLFGFEGIRKYQFIQETVEQFRLLLVPTPQFKPEHEKAIRAKILHTVGETCSLEIKLVDEIPPSRSGKHLFIISRVPLPVPVPRLQSAVSAKA